MERIKSASVAAWRWYFRLCVILFCGWLALLIMLRTPVEWYAFDPGNYFVNDATPFGRVVMRFDPPPAIKAEQRMTYTAVVRNVISGIVVCDSGAQGPRLYVPEDSGRFPAPLTLGYWGYPDPRCASGFLPGAYKVRTCWRQHDWIWIFPPKSFCRESNVFHVREPDVQIQIIPPKLLK